MNRELAGLSILLIILIGIAPMGTVPSVAQEDSLEKSVVLEEINV